MSRQRVKYWTSRPGSGDYANYWGKITDPDGRVRNRMDEREQFIADIDDELTWLRSLTPGVIVDVGCGPGWLLSELSGFWGKIGVEVCEEAIKAALDAGLDVVGPSAGLSSLGSGLCDVVICHHVIEHCNEPWVMLTEMRRILRSGGRLLMATPDFLSPCAVRFGKNYRLLHDPTHVSLFTREGMTAMLVESGFTIDRLAYPFPFRFQEQATWDRWNDTSKVSPPWPGNFLTFYCTKG